MTTDITELAQLKPGRYAILYRDNWDGEENEYHTLAVLTEEGGWYDDEFNAELLTHQGDKILKVWPLDDGPNVLKLVEALELKEEQRANWFQMAQKLGEDLDAAEKRIAELDAELEREREKSRRVMSRIAELESRTVTDWIEHDGKWRPESLGLDELVYLKTRKQELKIPYPAGKVKGWMNTGGDMDVMAYKLASPQASTVTVKLPDEVDVLLNHLEDVLPFEVFQLIDAHKWNAVSRLSAAGIKVEAE